jgi:hypothetical protein
VAVWLVRAPAAGWWLAGAAVIVASAWRSRRCSPVLLDPVFNDFEEVRAGQLRADVLELAREPTSTWGRCS